MISEKVQKEIDSTRKFGEQLEDIVVSKNQFPTGDRNVLLIAYWALMFDYHKGILSLLQSEFFGAAFARAAGRRSRGARSRDLDGLGRRVGQHSERRVQG